MNSRPRTARRMAIGVAATGAAALLGGCGLGTPSRVPSTTTITVTPTASGTTSGTSSSTTTANTKPPTTYDEAMQHLQAAKRDPAAGTAFTSPTGNIFCAIGGQGGVPPGCELKAGRIAPPSGTCDTGGGGAKDIGRIEWSSDAPKPICNTDSMIQPGVPALQYGSYAAVDGSPYQCVSESIGMTCVDTKSKKGFFLARSTYQLF